MISELKIFWDMRSYTFYIKLISLFQVKRARGKGGLAGPDGSKSVFGQLAAKQAVFNADSLMLPHRVWKVKFVGKSHTFICSPLKSRRVN